MHVRRGQRCNATFPALGTLHLRLMELEQLLHSPECKYYNSAGPWHLPHRDPAAWPWTHCSHLTWHVPGLLAFWAPLPLLSCPLWMEWLKAVTQGRVSPRCIEGHHTIPIQYILPVSLASLFLSEESFKGSSTGKMLWWKVHEVPYIQS